ncbi:hypothetical protein [Pseudorhodobacter ferrugineus]|uniref:hypothetical protein n=1 Tax=Pseudorhodobacter ferrugineus TaxID=77008 RepID=UPI00042971C4|nr:hypothetical protein [Pseudorhodobacter ferrugineus]
MKSVMFSAVISMVLSGAAFAETKQVVRQLKNCGSEATNQFGKHFEKPAVNEGNGYVGLSVEQTDATGTKERYTLVNCATRKMVQLQAEYLLKNSSKGLPAHGDLFAFTDALRKQKKLANLDLLVINGKKYGYVVVKGQLAKAYTEKARRGDCACGLYYPETM